MQLRTDLALEKHEQFSRTPEGVDLTEQKENDAVITKITIKNQKGVKALGKPIGNYITVEVPSFSDNVQTEQITDCVARQIADLIPESGTVLITGLGNRSITPDTLGPMVADRILATRHIKPELARSAGIEKARSVAVLTTGVLGQTGIESFDIIKGVCDRIKPSAVIAVDALASRCLDRLGCTVQLSDSGIEPGAGVGNARNEISFKTLGIPVTAIGVPTVVEASDLVLDLTGGVNIKDGQKRQMIVTPREIDLLIDRAAKLVADALNRTLQPFIEPKLITEIMG